jgi:hypothetical protein
MNTLIAEEVAVREDDSEMCKRHELMVTSYTRMTTMYSVCGCTPQTSSKTPQEGTRTGTPLTAEGSSKKTSGVSVGFANRTEGDGILAEIQQSYYMVELESARRPGSDHPFSSATDAPRHRLCSLIVMDSEI